MYVAGFPCQPFSSAGKQQGFKDSRDRGTIFFNVLEYITAKQPKIFVLENVKGLVVLDGGKCLKTILKALHSIKPPAGGEPCYEVHHRVLNTKDHGVPQSRPRWYCVGIHRSTFAGSDTSLFRFPEGIPCMPIEDLLDPDVKPELKIPSPQAVSYTHLRAHET